MKPTIETDTQLTDRLPGETVKLSLDLSQMQHFMKILTDLYEDGELAVIREYSTNADDSHAMAGVKKPIRISLPTPLRQTFEVRDFGLGMSYDDIKNTYGTYGASTKRETNDANGCLGLGSKSALTYTNMFSVRSVKNGELVHVAIYRDDEGTASMKFVTKPQPTDESNNTTIIVPTKESNRFEEKALKFYSTWPKGSVEVVDHEIPFVQDRTGAFWVSDKILIVPNNGDTNLNGKVNVVMGNVTYPYTSGEGERRWKRNYSVYYYAKMDGGRDGNAEVDFVPSREALNLNDKTRAVVTTAIENSDKEAIIAYAQKKISAAKDLHTAAQMVQPFTRLHSAIRDGAFQYNGTVLASSIKVSQVKVFYPQELERGEMVGRVDDINVDLAHKSLFIVDKPEQKPFLYKNKEQVRVYMKNIGLDLGTGICFFTEVPDNKLLEGVQTAHWEDIKQIPVSIEYQKGAKRPPKITEYSYAYKGEFYRGARPLPVDVKEFVYCVNINTRSGYNGNSRINEWSKIHDGTCFVFMTPRRVDKFIRENPKAVKFEDWKQQKTNKLPKIEKHEADYLALYDGDKKIMQWAIEAGIKDDHLVKIASVDKDKVEKIKQTWYTYGKQAASNTNYIDDTFPIASVRHEKHTKAYLKGLTLV